jgi:DNA-binding NarL/FixJ family response regulator
MVKRAGSQISLVLLDLSMPGMGGEDVLPEFRKLRPDMKVLVSSGYSEDETLRLFHGQQVSGFIQKPYTSSRLVEKIKSAIE